MSRTGLSLIAIEIVIGAAIIGTIWLWPTPHPEQQQADRLLAIETTEHPILKGVVVVFRVPPNGYTACADCENGIIIVSPFHGWELKDIIPHECDHLIDYRTDGHLDYDDRPKR